MRRTGHITGCIRLLLQESRAHQTARALALAPSKLRVSALLHSARPALCARSLTRLVRSHQGSIKRTCRAAYAQFPISTQANNNNGRLKHQPAAVPTLTASTLHAVRTAKGLAVGEPTQLSSSSSGIQLRLLPRHERKAGAYLQGTANSHQGYTLECIKWRGT